MKVIKDFSCECGNEFEEMVDNTVKHTKCPVCQSEANMVYSLNFKLDGTDPGYPTAYERWARSHERGGKLH